VSRDHVRLHTSWTARGEKRLLLWIAPRLPAAITSDHLSIVGLTAMAGAGLAFAAMRWVPAAALGVVAALAANWFGDSLDGTVARVRRQERPRFGYYVDHAIDVAGTSMLLCGVAVSGLMDPALAFALLAAYLLVSAESYLAAHANAVFRLSHFGVGPTELRIILAAGVLKAAATPWITLPTGARVRLFDVGAVVAIAGLVTAFVAAALRNACALHRAEPLRRLDADRTARTS
jgi:phosphatidylglycerophosphate synthase